MGHNITKNGVSDFDKLFLFGKVNAHWCVNEKYHFLIKCVLKPDHFFIYLFFTNLFIVYDGRVTGQIEEVMFSEIP